MQQNGYRFVEIGQLRPDGWPPGKIYSVRPCEKKPFFPKFQAEVLVDGRVAGFFVCSCKRFVYGILLCLCRVSFTRLFRAILD